MDIQKYTKTLDEMITRKIELKNQAHKDYNISWKHMNKHNFAMKLVNKLEDDIIKLLLLILGD